MAIKIIPEEIKDTAYSNVTENTLNTINLSLKLL